MNDPGEWLLTHEAPPDLLRKAFAPSEPPRRRWPAMIAAAAAVFALGFGLGRGASPTASGSVPVRLVLHAPDATTVHLAGTWNDWDPAGEPMIRQGDGWFELMADIPAGRHEYMFVVDGSDWVSDPSAMLTRDDGFGRRNAVLEVGPPQS